MTMVKHVALGATLVLCASAVASLQRGPVAAGSLTSVDGIRVGQVTLSGRPTGCTVILVDGDGAVGGVSQRGAAPGTRETDLLDPLNMVERVNGIALSGGSAYGLDVAQGVMRYLEEHRTGFPIGGGVVPIVPAAVIFDLGFGGRPDIRPASDCGYRAATSATSGPVAEGNIGAGAGATVGKLAGRGAPGPKRTPMKAGVGSAAIRLDSGLVVAALAVVNAANSSSDCPRTSARHVAVWIRFCGSFRFPRNGWGER